MAAAGAAGIAGYAPADPAQDCSLRLNIMDPRVGTHFPTTLGSAFAFAREPAGGAR